MSRPAIIAASGRLTSRGGLGEVALGRGLDPEGAGAEIDPVEVDGEDLLLAELGLEPDGVDQLLQLAAEGALVVEVEVLHQLLGDRAAALDDAAGAEVGQRGAGEAEHVDAEMAPEAGILGGDHGLHEEGRDLVELDIAGPARAAAGERAAVRGQDRDRWAARSRPGARAGRAARGRRRRRGAPSRSGRPGPHPRRGAAASPGGPGRSGARSRCCRGGSGIPGRRVGRFLMPMEAPISGLSPLMPRTGPHAHAFASARAR